MRETQDTYLKRIESDLTSFADPGGVDVLPSGTRAFHAEWKMRGEPREAAFTVSPDRRVAVSADGIRQDYAAFLADTRMADLKHVARMIRQPKNDEIFVATKAHRPDRDDAPESATRLLTRLMEAPEPDVTEVIMVTGGAGAGKTRVLRELVWQQADRYLHGKTDKLLLYVNAQGRALARLNEALATELQDLRVSLTYHSVVTLVRVGLLIPVIDGFDELLGVSGYDDAFSSLTTFLEQLDGYGRLIASARSIYYEEEFLSRAGQSSATGHYSWSHVSAEIMPWDEGNQSDYLTEFTTQRALAAETSNGLRQAVQTFNKNDRNLLEKPLFFARTVDLMSTESGPSGDGDLLEALIHSYLTREQTEKLLDRQQRPLLSEDQLELLVRELAEDMWNQETRELDSKSVRDIADYVLEDSVEESERQIVVERMPALAFLTHSEKHGTLGFEHEVFFFYFVADIIAEQLISSADLRAILSRSALPGFVADRISSVLIRRGRLESRDDLQGLLDRLATAGRERWRRSVQVQENAGQITAALLKAFALNRKADIVGIRIGMVAFPGGDLSGVTLRNCTLENVTIRRTNLETTRFIACRAKNVTLEMPLLEVKTTTLELGGLRVPEDVLGVAKRARKGAENIYDPDKVIRLLAQCGAPVDGNIGKDRRSVSSDTKELIEQLMHAYERANPVCDGDDHLRGLFRNERWGKLRKMLIEHGIVKVDPKSASGPRKEFLRRLFLPEQIMSGASRTSGAPRQIARFWDDLEKGEI